jgi:hypothetical protein
MRETGIAVFLFFVLTSVGGDRFFLGSGELKYSTVTVRYRRPTPKSMHIEIGFGIMKGGEFADLMYLKALER